MHINSPIIITPAKIIPKNNPMITKDKSQARPSPTLSNRSPTSGFNIPMKAAISNNFQNITIKFCSAVRTLQRKT